MLLLKSIVRDWPRSLSENQIYQIMGMLVLPHRSGIGPGPLPLSLGQQVALILSTTCAVERFSPSFTESAEKRYWTRTDLASLEASVVKKPNEPFT
jgi:hypothetical protein